MNYWEKLDIVLGIIQVISLWLIIKVIVTWYYEKKESEEKLEELEEGLKRWKNEIV